MMRERDDGDDWREDEKWDWNGQNDQGFGLKVSVNGDSRDLIIYMFAASLLVYRLPRGCLAMETE